MTHPSVTTGLYEALQSTAAVIRDECADGEHMPEYANAKRALAAYEQTLAVPLEADSTVEKLRAAGM